MDAAKEMSIIYTTLEPAQAQVVGYWHSRTSMLWNAVVAHMGTYAETYFTEPPSEASDAGMEKIVDMVYNVLVDAAGAILPEFRPEACWSLAIHRIKELPHAIVEQRLGDLKLAYRSAKVRKLSGTRVQSCAPTVKESGSNRSVRFPAQYLEIDGDVLTVHGPQKLVIQHESFCGVMIRPSTTLSITRRRVRPSVRESWNLDPTRRPYSFTFVTL